MTATSLNPAHVIVIGTLPKRERPLNRAELAAVLGGGSWWRSVWRCVGTLRMAVRTAVVGLIASFVRWRKRAAWQHAFAARHRIFRSFWHAFRF